MEIHKSYRFRLYPTKDQVTMLLQQAGNSRFVWNKLLEFSHGFYDEFKKFPSQSIYQKKIIELKSENDFLSLAHSQPLQINAQRLADAYRKTFKPENVQIRKQKIAIAQAENNSKKVAKALGYAFPKFKSKNNYEDSLFYPQNFKIKKSRIFVSKLGWIKFIKHRNFEGKPAFITIKQDGNLWFVSITCEVKFETKEKKLIDDSNIIGIDVGITNLAVFSDNTYIENPKITDKYQKKINREQKKLPRKEMVKSEKKDTSGKFIKVPSSNRQKQIVKLQKVYRKVRNIKRDFSQKLTHYMINKYDGFCIESLDIQNMLENNCSTQNRNTSDVAWFELLRELEYKSIWNSKYFTKIDQYKKSTKTCVYCGHEQEMPLNVRIHTCEVCGKSLERDFSSSVYIQKSGVKVLKALYEVSSESTVGTTGFEACEHDWWTKQEKKTLDFRKVL